MKHLTIAAGLTVLFASSASAATFTDRALFEAAAGPVTTETFESSPLSGSTGSGALPSISFDDFTVSGTPDSVKVIDQPFFGAQNTTPGGANYLYLDTDVGFVGLTMTMTFDAPTTAFGFDYSGLGGNGDESTLTVDGQTFTIPKTVNTTGFWGFTSATAISSFSINTGNNSAFGMDDVSIASSAPVVPLPAALPFLIAALGSFGIIKRRRRSAA